jgi:hypothetical protein
MPSLMLVYRYLQAMVSQSTRLCLSGNPYRSFLMSRPTAWRATPRPYASSPAIDLHHDEDATYAPAKDALFLARSVSPLIQILHGCDLACGCATLGRPVCTRSRSDGV